MEHARSKSLLNLTGLTEPAEGGGGGGGMRRSLSQVFMPDCKFAAVEGGGTTFRVAIAHGDPTNVVDRAEFATTTPAETLGKVCRWLAEQEYDAIGIASFGPIDPNPASPTFGYITTTPKPGWKNADIVGPILAVRRVPFMFDTDVNAPAMAEFTLGGVRRDGCSSCAYVTVGTGIGVGLVVNGKSVHGLLHPEGGMVSVPRFDGDSFHCVKDMAIPTSVEAMAASSAIAQRAGVPTPELAALPDSHPVWDEAAHYLAGLCANLILIASPERIVLGGGVFNRACLYDKVRAATRKLLNGYIQVPALHADNIDNYIVSSVWGAEAGLVGALALGQVALLNYRQSQALGVQTSAPVDNSRDSETYGFVMDTRQKQVSAAAGGGAARKSAGATGTSVPLLVGAAAAGAALTMLATRMVKR